MRSIPKHAVGCSWREGGKAVFLLLAMLLFGSSGAALAQTAATLETSPAPAAAAAEPPSKFLNAMDVSLFLSTGQELTGPLSRVGHQGKMLFVQVDRKRQSVYPENILDWKLTPAPADIAYLSSLPAARQDITLAEALLKKDLFLFAEGYFGRSLKQYPAGRATIAEIYKKAKCPLPQSLGGEEEDSRRYQKSARSIVERNMATAKQWGERMKAMAPSTHLLETEHFLIYSAWSKSNDAGLKSTFEKLYDMLCKQFDIPAHENIWQGKLPAFCFVNRANYEKFTTTVCGIPPVAARLAAGFSGYRGPYQYVMLSPVQRPGRTGKAALKWFYELLTHETTHAFMVRFISPRRIPSWLNEGIAETIASIVASERHMKQKIQIGHAAAKKGMIAPELLLSESKNIPLETAYYGAAQSLVKYLIQKDRKAFVKFVTLIKQGQTTNKALQESYKMDLPQLFKAWSRAVR